MAQSLDATPHDAPPLGARATAPHQGSARGVGRAGVWALALLGGALFGAAVLLWFQHGATVFFDTMSAGIASCL